MLDMNTIKTMLQRMLRPDDDSDWVKPSAGMVAAITKEMNRTMGAEAFSSSGAGWLQEAEREKEVKRTKPVPLTGVEKDTLFREHGSTRVQATIQKGGTSTTIGEFFSHTFSALRLNPDPSKCLWQTSDALSAHPTRIRSSYQRTAPRASHGPCNSSRYVFAPVYTFEALC